MMMRGLLFFNVEYAASVYKGHVYDSGLEMMNVHGILDTEDLCVRFFIFGGGC